MNNKALPNHLFAEQQVLGSVFLDPKIILDLMDKLTRSDFFDAKHQVIFDAIVDTYNDNLTIDYTTVLAKLEHNQTVTKAGGAKYLFELSEHVPSIHNLDSYIKLVLDASLKREVIHETSKIAQDGFQEDLDANIYVTDAEERIFAISQKRSTTEFAKLSNVIDEVKDKIEQISKNKSGISGLSTGYSNLDRISSGFQPEELIILAARPSMGKSAFALNIALNAAKQNKNRKAVIAIFSLEMANDQLASRMISCTGDISGNKLKSGQLDSADWQNLRMAEQVLSELNIVFDDSAAVSVSDIRAKCRKLKQDRGLDLVIIDYLQLIKEEGRSGNRQEDVAKISRALKQMARELKVPVLALSQLSRLLESRDDKRPLLSDLRESGSIEQDADIVLFLYRDEYYQKKDIPKTGDTELIVAKNRQGQSAVTLTYKFQPSYSRFNAVGFKSEGGEEQQWLS